MRSWDPCPVASVDSWVGDRDPGLEWVESGSVSSDTWPGEDMRENWSTHSSHYGRTLRHLLLDQLQSIHVFPNISFIESQTSNKNVVIVIPCYRFMADNEIILWTLREFSHLTEISRTRNWFQNKWTNCGARQSQWAGNWSWLNNKDLYQPIWTSFWNWDCKNGGYSLVLFISTQEQFTSFKCFYWIESRNEIN